MRLGSMPPSTNASRLSASMIDQLQLRHGGRTQLSERLLQVDDRGFGWPALLAHRLQQCTFGGACRLASGGEADRWPDTADAVQTAITIGDCLE
jgi:hypothetical protein